MAAQFVPLAAVEAFMDRRLAELVQHSEDWPNSRGQNVARASELKGLFAEMVLLSETLPPGGATVSPVPGLETTTSGMHSQNWVEHQLALECDNLCDLGDYNKVGAMDEASRLREITEVQSRIYVLRQVLGLKHGERPDGRLDTDQAVGWASHKWDDVDRLVKSVPDTITYRSKFEDLVNYIQESFNEHDQLSADLAQKGGPYDLGTLVNLDTHWNATRRILIKAGMPVPNTDRSPISDILGEELAAMRASARSARGQLEIETGLLATMVELRHTLASVAAALSHRPQVRVARIMSINDRMHMLNTLICRADPTQRYLDHALSSLVEQAQDFADISLVPTGDRA